ncbi:MAG: hypothetical protein EWV41_06340 [Microcystis wesenbergii Mw_MB_S_20031200_S109]|uniref:Uncharacterized protein n=1 Tax=Microcystis wesenbergii Mw_MB_S_20031200_S109D TaxID=2486241 RepID=A0A552LMR9_9CHRO|nr:MAG: hypothetical protein EWV41_06340 [Microcystis wesenbergii Mw_MB_S_20031200_S109]TRV21511.1 MAG: hypothetical protein EWV88_14890 [Microcystis wesenbergii Mw_MB_S_20031200_S109D]
MSVGCGVWGVGCGVWGVGCGVWGVGCGVRGVGFYQFSGSQLPNFPPNHSNRWHFLISKKPKDIIQQGF